MFPRSKPSLHPEIHEMPALYNTQMHPTQWEVISMKNLIIHLSAWALGWPIMNIKKKTTTTKKKKKKNLKEREQYQ